MNHQKNDHCPICNGDYFQVRRANYVCEKHEDWLVTTCDVCGNTCFSETVGICMRCEKHRMKGNIDEMYYWEAE